MRLSLIKQKIRNEMAHRGLKAGPLAKAAGLGTTAVRDLLENEDQDPRLGTLAKVCEALDISLAALFSDDHLSVEDSVLIPVLNVEASAGHGRTIDSEETRGQWAIPKAYLETLDLNVEALRIIITTGDSMQPEYWPGDRILVDTSQKTPSDGDYVIVDAFGNVLVKKIQVVAGLKPPVLKIISLNKSYETFEVPADEIYINGKVVGKWNWK